MYVDRIRKYLLPIKYDQERLKLYLNQKNFRLIETTVSTL